MTENDTTEKMQPSPAKQHAAAGAAEQTGGANRSVSATPHIQPPNILEEQAKTDQGLPRAPEVQPNSAPERVRKTG